MVVGKGYEADYLSEIETRELIAEALTQADLVGKRVLVLIPDSTRTAPIPMMFSLFRDMLAGRVAALDYLVALGTHPPMSDTALSQLVGQPVLDGRVGDTQVFNHHWDQPETFITLGTIPAVEIEEISGGLLSQDVPVRLNKLILDYDHLFICGPSFPHEVVGFSGGNKYFFPGISGPEIINFTHWLGALITSYKIIGTPYTPVRAVIDRAASLIDRPRLCFDMVVKTDESHNPRLAGLYIGTPEEAYSAAAGLSSRLHIVWVDRPFQRVLSVMPPMAALLTRLATTCAITSSSSGIASRIIPGECWRTRPICGVWARSRMGSKSRASASPWPLASLASAVNGSI
ncbi:MAG: lactate racemase domain-containing protein [Anaerolineae bacterium]